MLASTQHPWSDTPCEQSGEQFSSGLVGAGNYGRESCFLTDLWYEMAGALFLGSRTSEICGRKTTSLRFDSRGVTRWCICVPGMLLWQRAEEQQADPQLSSCVYALIVSSWLKGSVRACHRRTALPGPAPDLNVMRYESIIC